MEISKSLQELYCRANHCSENSFERQVYWRCLHRHALPLAPFLRIFAPDYFVADLDLIRTSGRTLSLHGVNSAIRHYITDPRNRGWMRGRFHVRLSTHRLRKLASRYLPQTKETASRLPEMDSSFPTGRAASSV